MEQTRPASCKLRVNWFSKDASTRNVISAEICMRVVIEGTPADAARIFCITRNLIVNSRVPQRVLCQTAIVIE